MDELKTARIKEATYENIYFDCPYCQTENIINRATDLHSRAPISGMEVRCQAEGCRKVLWLTSDRMTQADYMWFFINLSVLKKQKLYRDYILSLCQGVEMFFIQALINSKLDRNPLFRETNGVVNLQLYNYVRRELESAWKAGGFVLLRDLFREEFKSYRAEFISPPSSSLKDNRAASFKEVNRTKINELRNMVVHSTAYRPTLADIEAQDKLEDAVLWLGQYLNVTTSHYLLNKKLGRPKLEDLDPRKIELAKRLYRDRKKTDSSVDDICKQLGIGRTTLYRYIGERE